MKINFICHGNICRSPMAEFVMKDLVRRKGMQDSFEISSSAVSYEEDGNDIYPPAKRKLYEHGVPLSAHNAHRIDKEEFESSDLVLVMDSSNLARLRRIVGDYDAVPAGECARKCGIDGKVHRLMEFARMDKDVADPWYTGDFETSYRDILAGCAGLLDALTNNKV